MNKMSLNLFIKENDIEIRVCKIESVNEYYLRIGDFTIYNPELIKDKLIEALNKIEDK